MDWFIKTFVKGYFKIRACEVTIYILHATSTKHGIFNTFHSLVSFTVISVLTNSIVILQRVSSFQETHRFFYPSYTNFIWLHFQITLVSQSFVVLFGYASMLAFFFGFWLLIHSIFRFMKRQCHSKSKEG